MANESILISEVIPGAPMRIFNAWLDSTEHSAFTGSQASIEPGLGGTHSAFDGYIQGRILELQDGSRIVQTWRTSEFPAESPDSRLEITLEPTLGGTLVTLLHTDIPSGQSDRYRSGWNDFYLSRLKAYFSAAPVEADAEAPEPTQRVSPELVSAQRAPAKRASRKLEPAKRASAKRASAKRMPKSAAKRATPKRKKASSKAHKGAGASKRSPRAGARKTKTAAPKMKKSKKKPGQSSKRPAARPKRRK